MVAVVEPPEINKRVCRPNTCDRIRSKQLYNFYRFGKKENGQRRKQQRARETMKKEETDEREGSKRSKRKLLISARRHWLCRRKW